MLRDLTAQPRPHGSLIIYFFCNISLGLATNQITTYNEYVYLTSFSLPIKNIIFSKWGHNPHNLKIEHGMIFFLPSTSRSSVISAQKAITTPITLLFFRHKNTSNEEEKGDSGYHCSKISGSQQSFLTETAICIVEQWKKSMGYRFVPVGDHVQESQTRQPFRYFLLYLQDHGLLRPRNHGNQGNVI